MLKEIKLTISEFVFKAELYPEKAPKTCSEFQAKLPLEGKVIHARWSGEAVWLPMDKIDINAPLENHTSHPSRGDLLFYPGGLSEKELFIPYGSSYFNSKVGQLQGSHFASIIGGTERLTEMGETVLWEGAKIIKIEIY